MSIASSYPSKKSRDTSFIIYNNNLYFLLYEAESSGFNCKALSHISIGTISSPKTKKNFLRNENTITFIVNVYGYFEFYYMALS